MEQSTKNKFDREELAKLKNNIKKEKLQRNIERLRFRLNEINQEKGASTSLSTLPIIKKDTVYQNKNFGIS